MRNRVLAWGVLLVLTAGMLAGCGKKEVDYSLDETSREEDGEGASASLTQFETTENWSAELAVTDKSGSEKQLKIDAKVVVPDADSMSVVEVERMAVDTAFRENFLKEFFGTEEIYYHDKAHYTEEELTEYIAEIEDMLEDYGAGMHDDMKASLEESLENYQALLPDALNSYTPAEEYESCNEFVGYREDILYSVHFGSAQVMVEPLAKVESCRPASLDEYESAEIMGKYSAETEEFLSNECTYSMEEAKNLAESFVRGLGRDNQVCMEEKPVVWHGRTMDENGNLADEAYALYGYRFTYGTGVDEVAFAEFPDLCDYDDAWTDEVVDAKRNMDINMATDIFEEKDDAMMKLINLFNGDRIEITVTDEGIVSMTMQAPVTITDITGSVELLPLDTIKDIMKNELTENGEQYDFSRNKKFDNLALIYLKTKDESVENKYSYVPAWCLSKKDEAGLYYHPVFINAIDGSVIYIDDFLEK